MHHHHEYALHKVSTHTYTRLFMNSKAIGLLVCSRNAGNLRLKSLAFSEEARSFLQFIVTFMHF